MTFIAFLFAAGAVCSSLLAAAALERRAGFQSARMRRIAGHEALRGFAVACALAAAAVVTACA